MRTAAAIKKSFVPLLALLIPLALAHTTNAQPSPFCKHVFFCLYDQNAAQSTPAAIEHYSEDLIRLAVPPIARESEIQILAQRLAQAELSARNGKGKMPSEAEIAQAFNHLMQTVHAPESMRTNEAALHHFRQHAAELKAFPSLFTAARNGTRCTPDEAVFLLYLLIDGKGTLYERNLDTQQWEASPNFHPEENLGGRAFMSTGSSEVTAQSLIGTYILHHDRKAIAELFAPVATSLGF